MRGIHASDPLVATVCGYWLLKVLPSISHSFKSSVQCVVATLLASIYITTVEDGTLAHDMQDRSMLMIVILILYVCTVVPNIYNKLPFPKET